MPTLKFDKFPVLSTARLVLRAHSIADAEVLYQLRSDAEVMAYIDRPRPSGIADITLLISNMEKSYEAGEQLVWAIALKEEPEVLIGMIGFFRADLPNHRAEVGYMLDKKHWRRGYIDEALKMVIDFGFKTARLHSISANINPGNDASRQLLLKHGFEKEAYFKESFYYNGRFLDAEIYGLLTNI